MSLSALPSSLVLFDNATTGHHLGMIELIARGVPAGTKVAVYLPDHLTHTQRVKLLEIPQIQQVSTYNATGHRFAQSYREHRELQRILRNAGSESVFHLNGDGIVPLLALFSRLEGRVSALMLSPASGAYGEQLTLLTKTRRRLLRLATRLACKRGQLGTLLCLDPSAPPAFRDLGVSARYAPDPIYYTPIDAPVHGIDDAMFRLLLFGSLSDRKGTALLLEAIRLVPSLDANRLELTLVGSIPPGGPGERLHREILQASRSSNIRLRLEFLPDPELWSELIRADVVALPYVRHRGSSGALVWAVASGRPVIASGFGLLGAEVDEYHLGSTVRTLEPTDWSQAIQTMMRDRRLHAQNLANSRTRYLAGRSREEFALRVVEATAPNPPV